MDFLLENETQNSVLDISDWKVHCRYRKGTKKGLVIAFDGWDPDFEYTKEYSYSRWKSFKSFGYSCLYFSHPSVYSKRYTHSIFIGAIRSSGFNNPVFLLIKKAISDLDGNVVFFGKSGGAFAALTYSLKFPRSRCLVVDPEVNISAHNERLRRKYTDVVRDLIPKRKRVVINSFNINTAIQSCKKLPALRIIQNVGDVEYCDNHAVNLANSYFHRMKETGSGRINTTYLNCGQGHGYDVSNADLELYFSQMLSLGYSSPKEKIFSNRPFYDCLLDNIVLSISLSARLDFTGRAFEIYYYGSESDRILGFSEYSNGRYSMFVESFGGVVDFQEEIYFGEYRGRLYIRSLVNNKIIDDFDFKYNEYFNNSVD